MGRISPEGQRTEHTHLLAFHLLHERLHLCIRATFIYPVAQQDDVTLQLGLSIFQIMNGLIHRVQAVEDALCKALCATGQARINYLYLHLFRSLFQCLEILLQRFDNHIRTAITHQRHMIRNNGAIHQWQGNAHECVVFRKQPPGHIICQHKMMM